MSRSFISIIRRKHQLERQEQARGRREYLGRLAVAHARLVRRETRQELDPSVTAVLEDFRKTAYPAMKVRTYDQGWSLGWWKKQPDGSLVWESTVDVLLRYDANGRANWFDCSGHNHYFTIPINLDTLAATLMHIYRPHVHRRESKK
jgi:hypothetical protein